MGGTHLRPGRRLSCSARVLGDLVVDVPAEFAVNRQVVRKRAETRRIAVDAATRLVTVVLAPPELERPMGDVDRLIAAVEAATEYRGLHCDFPLLAAVPAGTVTVAVHQDTDRPMIIGVWPGSRASAFGACGARYRIDDDRGASGRGFDDRADGGVGGDGEPANQVRRGPDEPEFLRHHEPRGTRRTDHCGARRDRHAGVPAGGAGWASRRGGKTFWRRCSWGIR